MLDAKYEALLAIMIEHDGLSCQTGRPAARWPPRAHRAPDRAPAGRAVVGFEIY